jgi:hypothetical protein
MASWNLRNCIRRARVLAPVAAVLAVSTGILLAAATFTPASQPTGWVAAPEVSDFDLTSGMETVYQGDYERQDWSGNLYAYPIDAGGALNLAGERWGGGAGAAIDNQDFDLDRRIVTMSASGTGIAFRWAGLSGAQQTSVGSSLILNYVRGDRSNEAPNGSKLRARASVLGDIVHSRPLYVESAALPMIYVGANDGILHAIDARSGREVYGYVPSMLLGQLKNLAPAATTGYTHTWFVDATPNSGDVTIGGTSHRLLAGGLGAGGKGLYALDITSDATTAPATETAAASRVLWEITNTTINNSNSASYAKLGYTYGVPLIGRMNGTGQSIVIAANGYLSSAGTAVLFVIDAANGALIRAIDTASGSAGSPNGLSSPTAVDTNGDGRIDYVYAGDIDGHLWKFDLSAASSASWSATLLYTTSPAQPIVGAPAVASHPSGGVMVAFATGRAFVASDLTDNSVFYAYGIRDGAPAGATTMLTQTLSAATYTSGGISVQVRTNTANAADWTVHRGWKVALPAGERVVGEGAFIANGRYYFTSWNPTVNTSSTPGGENWLHELEYLTGGAKATPFLDLNHDLLLNNSDRVTNAAGSPILGAVGVPVARLIGAGIQSQPILAQLPMLDATLFNQNPDIVFPPPATPPAASDPGVAGGHFDVDIYYPVCATKKGTTTCSWDDRQHFHQYDDKFDVTGVNMLNASSTTLNLVNAIASTSTPFRVLVMNQYLNPAVTLSVGGAAHVNVKTYGGIPSQTNAATLLASLPVYTRANIGTLEFNMPVDTFTPKNWWGNGDVRSGLHPTSTGCVNGMSSTDLDPTPGIQGERHNGALTIQLIKDTVPASALEMNVAGKPEYGWRVKQDSNWATSVVAEYTVFWHASVGCYVSSNSKWTKTPPPETAGKAGGASSRAPGSADPVMGVSQTTSPIVSTTTSTSGNVTTTVTTYANGSKLTVTRTTNADGTITIRSVHPDGSVDVQTIGNSGGSLIVGADESRLTARTGRVSWQERLRQ